MPRWSFLTRSFEIAFRPDATHNIALRFPSPLYYHPALQGHADHIVVMLMNVQRVGSLRRNEPRKKSVVECSEPRTSICVSYLIKDMFFFEHCMIDCFPLNVVAVSDRFMNTLDTPRRVILRVFHERDINWAARDRGDVVVYADGSINSRKLSPKGSKQTAGMMTRTHVAWPPIWFTYMR